MHDAQSAVCAATCFADEILHFARLRPEQPAIILPDRLVTYDMLAQGILRAETRIAALGLTPDDLVCVTLASPIRHLVLVAALMRLGQPSMSATRVEDILSLKLPVRVFLEDAGGAVTPGLRRILVDEDWFAGPSLPIHPARGFASRESLCRVGLSSGTTGVPKAVGLSVAVYHGIVTESHKVSDALGVRGRVLNLLSASGGWGLAVTAHALSYGGVVVFANAARQALQMASAYQVDAIIASTQQMRDLALEQARAPIPCLSLKAVMFAGSLAPPALMMEARARLCSQAVVLYGATEVGAIAATPVDRVLEIEGAVGYPQTGVTVEIVDEDDGQLPRGASGIVRMRTPAMSSPFPAGADHPGLRGDWFYPGDRGRLTEDGMLVIEGRTNEVINSGGVKRAPELIEEIVLGHPNVAEAAAFGVIGQAGLEEVNLAVVTHAPIGERHLIEWCELRGVQIARVFNVASLPRTTLGKIRREEVKASLRGATKPL